MALLKTLRSLIRNPNTRCRPCFHCSESLSHPSPLQSLLPTSPASPALPLSLILRLTSSHPMLFPPLLRGPLFLSSPAWKLSQSATPLYLRGREAIFPNDLLVRRFPIELRFGSAGRGVETQAPDRDLPRLRVDGTFLNLPNWISISRMLSGPLIGRMIINEWYVPAFCGLVIAGITDWLDGFLARKMNINSVFGSYLDPLADKVLIGCVALAMVEKGLLHPGLVFLIVLRDVSLVGGAVYRRASSLGWESKSWSDFVNLDATHQEKVEPLFISKVNTVFQLLLIAAALLQPEFGSEDTQQYITYLSWLVASTTVVSAVGYGAHFRHKSISAREKWLSR